MTSALRWEATRAILMIHNCDGQSHKTASIDNNFWRERRAETDSNRGPSAYQPNALPLGHTGSRARHKTSFLWSDLRPATTWMNVQALRNLMAEQLFLKIISKHLGSVQIKTWVWTHIMLFTPLVKVSSMWLKVRATGQLFMEKQLTWLGVVPGINLAMASQFLELRVLKSADAIKVFRIRSRVTPTRDDGSTVLMTADLILQSWFSYNINILLQK